MFSRPLGAFNTFSRDAAGDPSLLQIFTVTLEVLPFVRMQFGRSAAWLAFESFDLCQCIQTLLEYHGVMGECSTDPRSKGNATSISSDVTIGAELAAVRGVGARFLAPRELGTGEPSMLPNPKQSGCIREDAPALADTGAAGLLPLATLSDVSSMSCH